MSVHPRRPTSAQVHDVRLICGPFRSSSRWPLTGQVNIMTEATALAHLSLRPARGRLCRRILKEGQTHLVQDPQSLTQGLPTRRL
jgi:hypothetical protein